VHLHHEPGAARAEDLRMIATVELDLTDPTPADLQTFVAEAPKLTTQVVLALRDLDGPRVLETAVKLETISGPVGATSVAGMASLLVRAAEEGVLASVPNNHGLGSVMASAVVACRDRLLAQASAA
jgi:hypothetical protein